ncbi:MAG: serine/threonine protein kinase [Deltaproteobacteria bacterium]|nr:serine/threonine protein kinase [Deltaproteobacteria bacterium]
MAHPRSADALLETLDAETRDTLAGAPRATLRPRVGHDTARRALDMLNHLAGGSPTASNQLRAGDEIGRGGMGVIRAAEQVALGRTVAIKTVRPDHRDPDAALDLLREAWITGSLEHPNIVPVHHLGVDDRGLPLIVLKRIEGVAWADLIGDAAAVEDRFGARDLLAWNLGILLRVLDAVRFAHSRGIIHRDLKPANVMVGDFGEVYLLDWGIAVSLRADPTGRLPLASESRQIVGTPCYMAPEMADITLPLSERTDVYLAGAILCELLSGKPPHLATTPIAALASIALSDPALPADAPVELAAICRRAMHKDAAHRYASVDEMRLALQRYLEHRGSANLALGAHARLAALRVALDEGNDDEVHRLFGACRFGFHEALAVWSENADARDGLTGATLAVAQYELARDRPAAAVALLRELDPPPPLLAKAREAATKQAARDAELAKLQKERDLSVNADQRSLLVAVIGLVFTVIPLLMAYVPGLPLQTYAQFAGGTYLALAASAPLAAFAYRRFGTTEIDRRLLLVMPFMFFIQAMWTTCGWMAGIPLPWVQIAFPLFWSGMVGVIAILGEPRIAPASLGYLIAGVFAARFIEHRYLALAFGNAVLGLNAVAWYRLKCREAHRPQSSSDAARS